MRETAHKYEVWSQKWLEGKLSRLPNIWRESVIKRYNKLNRQSVKVANDYVRELVEPIEGDINISACDDELQALAKFCASQCSNYYSKSLLYADFEANRKCYKLAARYAVRYPFEFDLNQQRARMLDDTWWLRNLRSSHAKAREAAARDAGIVHKKHDVYVSDDTLERRKQQLRRNAKLLEGIDMLNTETGEVMNLADIAASGQANQANRYNELMTRITGFEQLAVKYGHHSMFVTLTTPSRMHAVLANGKNNPKYDGTKPDAAQKYLVHTWAKARAQFAKEGVKIYGLRVAEPHHDGTPHWHLIIFYQAINSQAIKLKSILKNQFTAADRDELGNDITPRVKIIYINPLKGTAAGYVMKYLAKNLGGIKNDESDEATGQTSESIADRVEAWASTWRIRQFQQIGGHQVSVWRELRRIDECQFEGKSVSFVKAWQACQRNGDVKASFAAYIESMGGLGVKAKSSTYCVDYDAVNKQGKYGLVAVLKVLGVGERFGREIVKTNRVEWVRG